MEVHIGRKVHLGFYNMEKGKRMTGHFAPGFIRIQNIIGSVITSYSIHYTKLYEPLLNITDLRKSNRIDFVGGIRGLEELKRRVDNGEMKAAFALYPVSMQQLMDIADSGMIMPPKTTWFEPKRRSGVLIHSLD